jgi:hypothetical protein
MNKLGLAAAMAMLLLGSAGAQNSKSAGMQSCPMHKQHEQDAKHAMMKKHGDEAMGFPQDRTTHHFHLTANGGAIEVTANNAGDKENADAIRSHLSHIAQMFGNGDFSAPMSVHDNLPPGVTTMKLLKRKIRYKYEEIGAGGRVRMESNDPVAVAAIHDFLRFQVKEHETGDGLTVDQ